MTSRSTISFVVFFAFSAAAFQPAEQKPGARRQPETQTRRTRRDEIKRFLSEKGIHAQVVRYVSEMDGQSRPYGFCSTDNSSIPKPLLVIVNPGAVSEPSSDADLLTLPEEMTSYAVKNQKPCIVIRPTGRGPGSLYQNYGEVDVFEAIRDAIGKSSVDPDRIVLFGHSMGGAATWYLTSHYPDFFAAGAPMSGYCDYRLWSKPGGYTFYMQPWEEPSWKARSAAFLVENFRNTPMWILHGEWDRGVGSGVPVEHSREMARRLREAGFTVQYTEAPKSGHHFTTPELTERIVLWLLEQRKARTPKQVTLASYDLRHNKSFWVQIDQLATYGERGFVDARVEEEGTVIASTTNIRTLSLGPIPTLTGQVPVVIDGRKAGSIAPDSVVRFQKDGPGAWVQGTFDVTKEKHHSSSGPISDLFYDDVILVSGSTGSAAEIWFNEMMVQNTRGLFRETNGGLHRGGIQGQNTVDLLFGRDTDLTEKEIRSHNLLLFGTPQSNALIQRFAASLPIEFGPGSLRICGRVFKGKQVSVLAVFPHPLNPSRYVAIHGGVTPDAITCGSHFNLLLLPDYLVYDGDKMLAWGFWNNQWR